MASLGTSTVVVIRLRSCPEGRPALALSPWRRTYGPSNRRARARGNVILACVLDASEPTLTRTGLTAAEMSSFVGSLLSRVSAGSVQVDLDTVPFASVDGEARNLDLQIDPLVRGLAGTRSTPGRGRPIGLWNSRRLPTELARRGWRLTLYDGTNELMVLGRGTSALTGHVHLNPAALWRLRKLV